MSSFNLYRRKMEASKQCMLCQETAFILEGSSATIIHMLRTDVDKQAALIINEKEGPDTVTVFTHKKEKRCDELLKTDYFKWKDKTYFVYEDIDIIREATYKKQKAYACNVEFSLEHQEEKYCGYYISSLAKYVDTTLQSNLNITDNDKPILIIPHFDWVNIDTKIIIKGKPYKIINYDGLTNDKIAYCSLDRDFISTQTDIVEEIPNNTFVAGEEIELDVIDGYFKTDVPVEIVSKTLNKVKFIIGFGIPEISITTKDAANNSITNIYKVVS